jgi:hypothetical protein
MIARISITLLVFACAAASAVQPIVKRYTPEIHGMLTSGGQPVSANVCLRQSGSEIRRCGYANATGHFFVPSSGPLHTAQTLSDGREADNLPTFWLETGNVQSPQKLVPVDAVTDRHAAIDLACDMSQAARSDPTFRACEAKAARPLVMDVHRDDAPYRMARPPSPMK